MCYAHVHARTRRAQVGAIRPQPSFSHKAGAVTCMAWHPYQPLLAAGCGDSTATVYSIDQAAGGPLGGGAGLKQQQQQVLEGLGRTSTASNTSWS